MNMQGILHSPFLLGLYMMNILYVGWVIWKRFIGEAFYGMAIPSIIGFGTVFSVSLTYAASLLFQHTTDSISFGVFLYSLIGSSWIFFSFVKRKKIYASFFSKIRKIFSIEYLFVFTVCVLISWFVMGKTFRMVDGGIVFGSNQVFDFGHALSIIRSFSLGQNIPFTSPFVSDTPHFYHFMFYFFVGILEHFRVPLVFALNAPSIVFFALFLSLVYFTPQYILGKRVKLVGWICIFLTLSHSTATWMLYMINNGLSSNTLQTLWHLSVYPFQGPYDGSMISIHTTLNVFVNQRHLALVLLVSMILLMKTWSLVLEKKIDRLSVIFIGMSFGFLMMWNMIIACIGIGTVIFLFMVTQKKKEGFFCGITCIACSIVWFLPYSSYYQHFFGFFQKFRQATGELPGQKNTVLYTLEYLLLNFTILPFFVGYGFLKVKKTMQIIGVPFLLLFVLYGKDFICYNSNNTCQSSL